LLYYPIRPQPPDTSADKFLDEERAEFRDNQLSSAVEIYTALATDTDIRVRADALNRLARVYRRMHNYDLALRAYRQLSEMTDATVAGYPADLIARSGRATTLKRAGRPTELREEATALASDLRRGRWQLTQPEYQSYLDDALTWLGSSEDGSDDDAMTLTKAAGWLWENRNLMTSERRLLQFDGAPVLIISRLAPGGVVAAIAGPAYLSSLCREAVPDPALQCTLSDAEGHTVLGQAPPSRFVATLTAASARLPWTLQVFASDPNTPATSSQRRLLFWAAAVLTAVWLTGAAFIVRAIGREARVAQLQSDFVAAVSHEFRSPLSSLYQISEMLADDRLESDNVRRQAYTVLSRESERLRSLIEDLLDFQRLEAGAVVYRFELIDIGAFIDSIVAEFQEWVAASGYHIELRAPEAAIRVKADREALRRAVRNLLDNAVKYSPESRTIWVDLDRNERGVSISVRDRGLGIPLHEQNEIFEKFVRGAESKARRIKGTGIGLAMVRHIVQAHGGNIQLASQPGEGSRFTIFIPEEVT
jgi:signal transduction histidine kinase